MKIMIFLHGTAIMHRNALGVPRSERVQQVKDKDPSVNIYDDYVSVGKSNKKIVNWAQQGAEIIFLSSHEHAKYVEDDKTALSKNGFPIVKIYYRLNGESYADVAERVMPDILIEDDCESIGGEVEMTYPHISEKKKVKIKSIVVKEFEGIDHLPDNIHELLNY